MSVTGALLVAGTPAVLAALFAWHQDRQDPEKRHIDWLAHEDRKVRR